MSDITKIQIETGIPIPDIGSGCPKSMLRLTLETMKPGQSFLFPKKHNPAKVHMIARNAGIKIVTRTVLVEGDKRIRIWRVVK